VSATVVDGGCHSSDVHRSAHDPTPARQRAWRQFVVVDVWATIGGDHSTGGLCSVFYEREIAFAHTHQHPVATILALVIA